MFREDESTVPVQSAEVHRLRLPRARIEVLSGPDAGLSLELPSSGATLGTAEDCELRLSDRSVSRRHLEFAPEADAVRVRDTGSMNGTLYGGARIREVRVSSDAMFAIGESTVALRLSGESVSFPLSTRARFGDALGVSTAMRRVFALLEQAAPSAVTVLLEGDSGTGKDVLARALHQESGRREGAFVVVDCSAIPDNLVESELFGHEKGAFTGATAARAGAFEQANGGTIFLDEIGELPLLLQPKLLRVLENRSFRRVGGASEVSVDVRVVAATNRRLAQSVRNREFREDLYYRLAVVHVVVPRLRERPDDIPLLAEAFLRRATGDAEAKVPPELATLLSAYPWPGNARELRNVIERFATFRQADAMALFGSAASPRTTTEAVDPVSILHLPYHEARQRVLESFHRGYLKAALDRAGGSITAAAEAIGIPRTSIHRMLQRLSGGTGEDE